MEYNGPKTKKRKNITFDITLTEEQKLAKAIILDKTITTIRGQAGSGKSLVACQVGLDMLFNKEVDKFIIARPAVTAQEDLGYLPGGVSEKLELFIKPIMDNFKTLYSRSTNGYNKWSKIETLMRDEDIEIVSIGHLRGRTFNNAFVLIDEAQNTTVAQMEMILTRLGKQSKMVITGDLAQTDIKAESGLARLIDIVPKIERLEDVVLTDNHRADIVGDILKYYNR